MTLTAEERIRRVAILCCHCLRNLAFYRAGQRHGTVRVAQQFWVNANGAFLDTCVLEWCKLFVDQDGKHHWKRVVNEPDKFVVGLLSRLRISQREFRTYAKTVLRYRNKFVAHLDDLRVMQIPRLRVIRKSTAYLYDYLRNDPIAAKCLPEATQSAAEFYAVMYQHAYEEYRRRSQLLAERPFVAQTYGT